MQQCREPYCLALSRRLAHGCQSVRRGIPAQCPDRGRLVAVPLGRGPSLHGLRRGRAPFVRLLPRYYSPLPLSRPGGAPLLLGSFTGPPPPPASSSAFMLVVRLLPSGAGPACLRTRM